MTTLKKIKQKGYEVTFSDTLPKIVYLNGVPFRNITEAYESTLNKKKPWEINNNYYICIVVVAHNKKNLG